MTYNLTTLPLSIATAHGKLRQLQQAYFPNYFIKKSKALHWIPLEGVAWFIDVLLSMLYGFHRLLKTKKTHKKWISALIGFIFPDSPITMKLLGFINDSCNADSIKNMTRQKRSTSSAKFNITGFEKSMLQGTPGKSF